MKEILANRIAEVLKRNARPMHIKEIAAHFPDKPESTVRGRLYRELKTRCERVSRGVYCYTTEQGAALVVEGNGRDLSAFADNSIDAIVTDHAYEDKASNVGTNRNFVKPYEQTTFRYELEDFKEKARVLKPGGFLVEFIPAENENNYDYLYQIKCLAKECGLLYYAKVPWKKGIRIWNTGRKSKNTEDIMFFVKGKARSLRLDKQRGNGTQMMSGTAYLLPTEFTFQPASPQHKVHPAEKPIELYEAILHAVTLPGEIVIDQGAGSGNLGIAAMRTGRIAVLFEILKENVEKIKERFTIPELPLVF